ncbi:uncharacterized protein LOC144118504 isoform X1 [Amblyomma americanum]
MRFLGVRRNAARKMGLAYVVLSLQMLAVNVAFMYITAMSCEAKRRLYVWITWGCSCLLCAVHLGFIITWTVAAAQDNVRWMTIGVTGIAVRLVGIIVHSVVYSIVNIISTKQRALSHMVASEILHQEEEWSNPPLLAFLFLVVIEGCFLSSMTAYVEAVQKATDREQLAAERSDNSDGAAAAGATATSGSKDED